MIGQKKPRGSPIGDEKLDKLRELYLAGATIKAAAVAASVSSSTAFHKFHAFKKAGLVGGAPARRAGRPARDPPPALNAKYPASWEIPQYYGPTWIGKRIDRDSRI